MDRVELEAKALSGMALGRVSLANRAQVSPPEELRLASKKGGLVDATGVDGSVVAAGCCPDELDLSSATRLLPGGLPEPPVTDESGIFPTGRPRTNGQLGA